MAPGDRVVVEDPGYPPARDAFAAAGARLVGVPVDREGLVTDALPRDVRVAVVTPAHQMPMGVTLSAARRAALLAWAERTGAVIVEDDYDSEFRYATRPLEPLLRLDRSDRVVYVGSFSKTLLPMLRIGFLVAPCALLPVSARQAASPAGSRGPSRKWRCAGSSTMARRAAPTANPAPIPRPARPPASAAMARDLAPWLRTNPAAAGLHVAALAADGVDAACIRRVVLAAAVLGVAVEPLESYAVDPRQAQAGIAMGFGRIDEASIERRCAASPVYSPSASPTLPIRLSTGRRPRCSAAGDRRRRQQTRPSGSKLTFRLTPLGRRGTGSGATAGRLSVPVAHQCRPYHHAARFLVGKRVISGYRPLVWYPAPFPRRDDLANRPSGSSP